MSEQRYTANIAQSQGRPGWTIIFRHPQPHESYGDPGARVRRGLGTTDEAEARRMADDLNSILADNSLWTPAAREIALKRYPASVPAVRAFYDVLAPAPINLIAERESVIPMPGRDDGYSRVIAMGTPGGGKTTLIRQMIGTDREKERFPSTSAAKTTTAEIELILREDPGFKAVVTFLPKEQVRAYIEDCVIAGVFAAVDESNNDEIARRFLEHRDQKFRLSYLLGTLKTSAVEADDDPLDSDNGDPDGAKEIGVEAALTTELPFRVPEYIDRISDLAATIVEQLDTALGVTPDQATGEDRDALEELLESELRKLDNFDSLVDNVLDDIELRFVVSGDGNLKTRQGDEWPVSFSFEESDREKFIARINRFSTNNARLFGRLLTPLVQGIRVVGNFRAPWRNEFTPLVLIDGEGFGHTSAMVTSLPSEVMRRLDEIDAVLLVDNASQAMQAGPGLILKSLVTAGHHAKLRVAFTKFDLVRGGNLRDINARQNHVRASLDQAVAAVGKTVGRTAERTLTKTLEGRVFFLSDIRKPFDALSPFTRRQLDELTTSLMTAIQPAAVAHARPIYDEANLVLAVQRAVQEFHENWSAILGLPSRANMSREHWTRVKALTRWVSQLNSEGYDTLTPVGDLEQAIRDRLYLFLDNPIAWDPPTADPDIQALAIATVCAEVNARLRDFSLRRVIANRYADWAFAYTGYAGTGSTRKRAHAINSIYDVAAPVPGETPDRYGNEFLREIRVLVRDAILAANGSINGNPKP